MGYSELSLPVDIPWKRLAVSSDMLDERYGDLRFPTKWDTSIAAFYHEPAEVDPAYCNRKITYIKIVCTITNYQLGGSDVTVLDQLRKSYRGGGRGFKEFESNVTRAYPCHGALLQVGVFPNPGNGVELYDYPYISSLQPRKRELYEVATQSGEVASQSANKLNVMKGSTTTGTTEDYDLDMGGGSGGHSGIFGLWSEQHSGEQKQVGTIQRKQMQDQNIATSDASRDRRESYSFSTSINQLHTLLQSYHLGTNRAIFFLQPVPHMQDAKFSFVRGLRRIEGIQEFFLIINRPAHVKGFCLEIALETAHTYVRRAYWPRLISLGDLFAPGNLTKSEYALGAAVQNNAFFDYYRQIRDAWNSMWAHERWAANKQEWVPTNERDSLAAEIPVKVPGIGAQDVALIFEEYEASTGYFFVTGRRFCACWAPKEDADGNGADPHAHEEPCEESSRANLSTCDPFPGSIVFVDKFPGSTWTSKGQEKAHYYNSVASSLNEALSSSLLSSRRNEYGTESFFSTDFMLEELTELSRNVREALPRDRRIREFSAARGEMERFVRELPDNLSFGEFGRLSTAALARRLKIDERDARRLRMNILLEALNSVDPQRLPHDQPEEIDESMHELDLRLARSARGTAQPPKAETDRKER